MFALDDERIAQYDKDELLELLKDNRSHSPEDSETGKEGVDAKRVINVYSLSWRSEEVRFNIFITLY